ncbi:MAG: ion channel [Candidatus Norongarragalinales archaeon]
MQPLLKWFAGHRRLLFYSARVIVVAFFASILFFDSVLKFILSNFYALDAVVLALVILALTHLYDLIYEEKKSFSALIWKYFFLTLSVILLFGILYYVNAVVFDPPGLVSTYEMQLEKDVFYFSAVTYFTVGYGEIVPWGVNAKTLSVFEAFFGNVINLAVLALAFRTLNLQRNLEEKKAFGRIVKHVR